MIAEFQGPYRFLSNFFHSPVTLDNKEYPTVEHAYQASKTLVARRRTEIRREPDPGEAKKLGRAAPLRADWEDVKISVMLALLRQKFKAGTCDADLLLKTWGQELVEGNTWGDTFWGVCRGEGENHLGKLLMQVREEIKDGY